MVRKARPSLPASRELPRYLVGHLRVLFCFRWHKIPGPPSGLRQGPRLGSKQGFVKIQFQPRQLVFGHVAAAWRGHRLVSLAARPRPPRGGHASRLRVFAPGGCRVVDAQQVEFQKSKLFISDPFRAPLGAAFSCSLWGCSTDFFLSSPPSGRHLPGPSGMGCRCGPAAPAGPPFPWEPLLMMPSSA